MPMKERGRIDDELRVRIEDGEIGVAADVDRALASEAGKTRWRGAHPARRPARAEWPRARASVHIDRQTKLQRRNAAPRRQKVSRRRCSSVAGGAGE